MTGKDAPSDLSGKIMWKTETNKDIRSGGESRFHEAEPRKNGKGLQ